MAKIKLQNRDSKKSGFTLIELAIVIVIIGLIVSGVLGAQSLINSSRRTSLISDIKEIKTAFLAFNLEYDSLPGDFDEATDYWSGTADGDNDGKIDYTPSTESHRVFEHLTLSEIYPGQYSYNSGEYTSDIVAPASPLGVANYQFFRSDWALFGRYGSGENILEVGRGPATDPYFNNNAGLLVKDTKAIDKKIDDGVASSGQVLGVDGANSSGTCNDSSPASDSLATYGSADYDLTQSDLGCRLYMEWVIK